MRFEGLHNIERELSHEEQLTKNEIQKALIIKSIKGGENIETYPLKWIEENAHNFATVFDEMLNEIPNITEVWNDPVECENLLAKIEDRMSNLPAFKQAA